MAYVKNPTWKDDPDHSTPIIASKLNNIEDGIANAHTDVAALTTRVTNEEAQPDIPPVVNGQWLKGAGGVAIWSSIVVADVASLQALLDGKAPLASAVMDGDGAGGVLAGTYPSPSFAQDMATQAELDAVNSLRASGDATLQANIDAGDATVQGNLNTHIADATDAHQASAIGFTPIGTIGATTVQGAIAEVAAEGGGGGGGGGVSYLSDLFDVTGAPPAVGEAPVWDGDSYELTDIVTAAEMAVAIGGIDMSAKVDKDSVVIATARLLASKVLAGDAQPAFRINGNGYTEWGGGGAFGPDVNLYRYNASVLATNSQLRVLSNSGLVVVGAAGTHTLRSYLADLDAQPAFRIDRTGALEWGAGGAAAADVTLFRNSANVLELPDQLFIHRAGLTTALQIRRDADAAHKLYIDSDGTLVWGDGTGVTDTQMRRGGVGVVELTETALQVKRTTATTVLNSLVGADTVSRFLIDGNGGMTWGPGGSTARDTDLFRAAANVLGSNDKFDPVALNLPIKTGIPVDGDIVGGIAQGDVVVDTTNSRLYVRAAGSWKYARLDPEVRQIPVQMNTPRTTSLGGNAFWSVTASANADIGRWEFVKDVDGEAVGIVQIPKVLATTSGRIILHLAANAVSGVTRMEIATAHAGPTGVWTPGLTVETAQDITIAGAYWPYAPSFPISYALNPGHFIIVRVAHRGVHANDTLAVNTLLFAVTFECDVP